MIIFFAAVSTSITVGLVFIYMWAFRAPGAHKQQTDTRRKIQEIMNESRKTVALQKNQKN